MAPTAHRLATTAPLLEFLDAGSGPPIIVFHGANIGADTTVLLERSLIDEGFRLIVPNRPGYFGSPLAPGGSAEDAADLAVQMLPYLGIPRATVLGISLGALHALAFAARYPSRTASLILECPITHPTTAAHWAPAEFRFLYPLLWSPRFIRPLFRAGLRWEAARMQHNPRALLERLCGKRSSDLTGDSAVGELLPLLAEAFARCVRLPSGIENDSFNVARCSTVRWDHVQCPTLVLHDPQDPVSCPSHAQLAENRLADVQRHELSLGGHLIWVGQDVRKMRQIRSDFIRSHVAAEFPQASAPIARQADGMKSHLRE